MSSSSQQPAETEDVSALDRMTVQFQATDIDVVLRIVRVMNGLMAVALAAVYPVSFATGQFDEDGGVTWQKFLLCVYSVCFAVMLIVFELRVENGYMNWLFKNMCGFMYSFSGRLFFLLFISSLALAGRATWNYVVGGCGVVLSLFNCCVVYNHPAFSDEAMAAAAKEEEVRQYIEEHPEVLNRAMAEHGVTTTVDLSSGAGAGAGAATSSGSSSGSGAPNPGSSRGGTFSSVTVQSNKVEGKNEDNYLPPSMASAFGGGGGGAGGSSSGGGGGGDPFASERGGSSSSGAMASSFAQVDGARDLPEDNPFA